MPKLSDQHAKIWQMSRDSGSSTLNTGLLASWPMLEIGEVDRKDYGANEFDFANTGGSNATGGGTRFEWYNDDFMEIAYADAGALWGSATDPFSIACSFKVVSWPVTSGLLTPIIGMTNFTVPTRGWLVSVLPDTVSPARGATFHSTTDGSDTLRIDGSVVALNTWMHYLFRYDGSNYKLMTNGVDATPVANASGFHRPTSLPLHVARYTNTGSNVIYGDVIVQNVSMWNRALTDGEVTEWYNGGQPKLIPFISA